jgi:hypothetical protein
LRVGVVYGEGIANYMNDGGMDLAPKNNVGQNSNLEAVPLVGVGLLRHTWNDRSPVPSDTAERCGKHELPNPGQHFPLWAIRLGET